MNKQLCEDSDVHCTMSEYLIFAEDSAKTGLRKSCQQTMIKRTDMNKCFVSTY